MKQPIEVELTKSELAMLVTVLHLGGWHRKKNLPKTLRNSDNLYIQKMSKIVKKLETLLGDD